MKTIEEGLTLENFWNKAMEKYPLSTKAFCEWIDTYKEKVDWKWLFNENGNYWDIHEEPPEPTKYHDLPIAMQFGIYMEFFKLYPILHFTGDMIINVENGTYYLILSHLEHLNKHLEKETYPCKVCGQPFKNYDDLYEHNDTVHNKGGEE